MAYNINVTGRKTEALSALRSQAASQRPTQTSAYEQGLLDKAVADAEEKVNQFAGDDDQVAISVNGNFSQHDRALGVNGTCGVTISKAATAPAPAAPGTPAPGVPATGPSAGTVAPPAPAAAPVPGTPAIGTR